MKIKSAHAMAMAFLLFTGTACTEEEPTPSVQIELITSSGAVINPNGEWASGCAIDLGKNISEVFTFTKGTITIDVNLYGDNDCTSSTGNYQITISAQTSGTYQATLNGKTVLANKISGTSTQQNSIETTEFQQGLYVDDSGDVLKFYHGRFEDDGGSLTADGYPLKLIPIAFQKK